MPVFDPAIFDRNIFDTPPVTAVKGEMRGPPVPKPKFPIYLIQLIRDYLVSEVQD